MMIFNSYCKCCDRHWFTTLPKLILLLYLYVSLFSNHHRLPVTLLLSNFVWPTPLQKLNTGYTPHPIMFIHNNDGEVTNSCLFFSYTNQIIPTPYFSPRSFTPPRSGSMPLQGVPPPCSFYFLLSSPS